MNRNAPSFEEQTPKVDVYIMSGRCTACYKASPGEASEALSRGFSNMFENHIDALFPPLANFGERLVA